MSEWYRQLQKMINEIDSAIKEGADEKLTLQYLADRLSYSPFYTSRIFHSLTGLSLREYLQGRRLAFSLIEVRDTEKPFLDIAVRYGFSSHEAFTRAFKRAYGITPKNYRRRPVPVVLRTKINPLDRYLIEQGVIKMKQSTIEIKIYPVKVPAHKFLHIKNYESQGYFDFWEKQSAVPGQDCDTICGILDSIKGKLDGDDSITGQYSGQIMAFLQEGDGRRPEAYGIRLPGDYSGDIPAGMLLMDIPGCEYMVFEHGPFDYETQCGAIFDQLDTAISNFNWSKSGYRQDDEPGRIAYYYNDPERFLKKVLPVVKE